VRRRQFITLLGGTVVAWPLAARAQQGERTRRLGVLMYTTPDEPQSQAWVTALVQGLEAAGWAVGRNLRIDTRWSSGDLARLRKDAADLANGSDVIVAGVGPTTSTLQQTTRTVPIVMAQSVDPVGSRFVRSLSRPGGNITGFTQFEYGLAAKWFELLREIAPRAQRVGVIREAVAQIGVALWAVIGVAAGPLGVELSPLDVRNAASEIERTISEFAREPNGSVIVVVSTVSTIHRDLIVALAARHKLPVIYPYRFFVEAGGLMSYGPNLADGYRRTATYVDRVLKGEKPADLPVQAPTKYELVLNLKTAKTLGLEIPPTLLARADEVIE
jgi:putative ABC transport system substrate-binding protein